MKVILAGGGTAGHINPAIAIAKSLKERLGNPEILFIGTKRGLETKLVPKEGFELKLIKVKGFKRKLSLDTLITIKELLQGLWQARRIVKRFKPDVVIGTGGYVCGPVVFVAHLMKIPTIIHEQNAFPGVTNRILSRFVDMVAISFKESEKYFKSAKRVVFTGNPVRPEIVNAIRQDARRKLDITEGRPLVVVMGGSLGAEKINSTIIEMIKGKYKEDDFDLIFATGDSQYEKVSKELESVKLKSLRIVPYIYNAADVYAAADLVVCRAGAITCSELTVLGVPSIMIPSPNVVENHQEFNARSLENNGASVVILEKDLTAELLYRQIMYLIKNQDKLSRMSTNASKMGIFDASERICSVAEDMAGKRGKRS